MNALQYKTDFEQVQNWFFSHDDLNYDEISKIRMDCDRLKKVLAEVEDVSHVLKSFYEVAIFRMNRAADTIERVKLGYEKFGGMR